MVYQTITLKNTSPDFKLTKDTPLNVNSIFHLFMLFTRKFFGIFSHSKHFTAFANPPTWNHIIRLLTIYPSYCQVCISPFAVSDLWFLCNFFCNAFVLRVISSLLLKNDTNAQR